MTQEEFDALKPGDKVRAIPVDGWPQDWIGQVIVVEASRSDIGFGLDTIQGRRESDGMPCSPGRQHIELIQRAKIVPLPLPG
jgi:hypothetical protein